jgi:hypothetical protein
MTPPPLESPKPRPRRGSIVTVATANLNALAQSTARRHDAAPTQLMTCHLRSGASVVDSASGISRVGGKSTVRRYPDGYPLDIKGGLFDSLSGCSIPQGEFQESPWRRQLHGRTRHGVGFACLRLGIYRQIINSDNNRTRITGALIKRKLGCKTTA